MGLQHIEVHFLPVGHTHEDIDQMFSRWGWQLNGVVALDQHELAEIIRKSYTPNPVVSFITAVADIKGMLQSRLNPLSGSRDVHAFTFWQLKDEKLAYGKGAAVFHKAWSQGVSLLVEWLRLLATPIFL